MVRFHLGLLSFGIILIIIAAWIAAWILQIITFMSIIPLILLSSGIWALAAAGVKIINRKEDSNAFSTFGWGILFIVLGGSLYMVDQGMNPLFILVFVLGLIGALAAVASLRGLRK